MIGWDEILEGRLPEDKLHRIAMAGIPYEFLSKELKDIVDECVKERKNESFNNKM